MDSDKKPIANIIPNGKILNAFPLRETTGKDISSLLIFNIVFELLVGIIRQERKKGGIKIRKEE